MPSPVPYIASGLGNILGQSTAAGLEGVVEGEKLKRKFAEDALRQQLQILEIIRAQHGQVIGDRLVGPTGQISELPPTSRERAEITAREASTAASRATEAWRRKQIETGGQPRSPLDKYLEAIGRGDQEGALKILEGIRATHVAGSSAPKEPASLDALLAKANDPTVAPEERRRAQQQADAIVKAREGIQRAGSDVREGVATRKEERKTESQLGPMQTAIEQMKGVLPALDAKGFLPKNAGVKELARSRLYQLAHQNDPDWVKWKTNQGALIGVDRSVYNDIGRGGMQMYSAVKEFSEHPPTLEAARGAFAQWEQAMAARRGASGGGAPKATMRYDATTGRLVPIP